MTLTTNQVLQLVGSLAQRSSLISRLSLQSYGGDRNVYQALGYPFSLSYEDYIGRYYRQAIARAVINRPVNRTWEGGLSLVESKNDQETKLEKEFTKMEKRLKLRSVFARLDRLTSIGSYGVLLLGTKDITSVESYAEPIQNPRELVYLKPFGEGAAKIQTYVNNPKDPRYGLPLTYNLTVQDVQHSNTSTSNLIVHYSRVIHVVYDNLDSEVVGSSVLEPIFNELMNIEKITGGDAEMFWRGARPGYHAGIQEGFKLTPAVEEDLINQIDEIEHNMRRYLIAKGIDVKSLEQQIADPMEHFDIQIQNISAETGIPKRILTGSERGELSSGQDADEWNAYIKSRRENVIDPCIVRAFVDRMIECGLLPKAQNEDQGYEVDWSDLFAVSEKDKVEVGAKRMESFSKYMNAPSAEGILSPEAFFEFFCGFTEDQINLIKEMVNSPMAQELARMATEEEAKIMEQEQLKAEAMGKGVAKTTVIPVKKPVVK
jgi:hypothetical protein